MCAYALACLTTYLSSNPAISILTEKKENIYISVVYGEVVMYMLACICARTYACNFVWLYVYMYAYREACMYVCVLHMYMLANMNG